MGPASFLLLSFLPFLCLLVSSPLSCSPVIASPPFSSFLLVPRPFPFLTSRPLYPLSPPLVSFPLLLSFPPVISRLFSFFFINILFAPYLLISSIVLLASFPPLVTFTCSLLNTLLVSLSLLLSPGLVSSRLLAPSAPRLFVNLSSSPRLVCLYSWIL